MFKKKKDQTYQSYWSISWNIFKKNKVAMVCLFIVVLLCLIALFAPLIAPYDPNKQVLTDRLMKPCGQHWFGTDKLGRDVLSRIIYGTQLSLFMGVSIVVIMVSIGTIIGAITIQTLTTTMYAIGVSSDRLPAVKAVVILLIIVFQSEKFKQMYSDYKFKHLKKSENTKEATNA